MRNAPFWIVDAFGGAWRGRALRGNPAAVVLLREWAPDAVMQELANEFALPETAFLVPREPLNFDLRWFTPQAEVKLCGHATLAAAAALLDGERLRSGQTARFSTLSGVLSAHVAGQFVELDFPLQTVEECPLPDELRSALRMDERAIRFCGRAGEDWLVHVSQGELERVAPDFAALSQLEARGVIATALPELRDGETDFLSRFFAPRVGIPEDPVTGSAHCALAPYWAARLEKTTLRAVQLSPRGGVLELRVQGERVRLTGRGEIRARGRLCS